MPIVQPYQYAEPAYIEKVFEKIRLGSPEDLCSYSYSQHDGRFLNLVRGWFCFKNLQTESCNFTSSLFADASMDVETLSKSKDILMNVLRSLEALLSDYFKQMPNGRPFTSRRDYPDILNDRTPIGYFGAVIDLAMDDHNMWLEVKKNNFGDAIRQLPVLKQKSERILPYRSKIYSSIEQSLMRQNPIRVSRGEDYKTKFNTFKDRISQTEMPEEIASYFTSDEYLNLKKLVSDEKYFCEKLHRLAQWWSRPKEPDRRIAESDESLRAVSVFSRDQLLENVGILHRILVRINDPHLTEFDYFSIIKLNGIFTKFLRYHQFYFSDNPEEKELLLQGIYNNFFENESFGNTLWCDYGRYSLVHRMNFEMLGLNDSYLLLVLKHFAKESTRIHMLDKDYHADDISFFAPWSYNQETFTHRIDVLNNLIEKIDTFEEITPEARDYLKKLFNLFLLDHRARMYLNEKKPEEAIKCLHELKEKSKGIFVCYSREGGIVDKLIKTCQSQISKDEVC